MAKVEISVTELPHFQRLVRFLEDAEELAHEVADEVLLQFGLQELVDQCRDDLAQLQSAWE